MDWKVVQSILKDLPCPGGEDFIAVGGDEKGVLVLGAGHAIGCVGGPVVLGVDVTRADTGIDHGLNGECHAGDKWDTELIVMVGDLRGFVEFDAGAMADELIDNGAAACTGVRFDSISNFID